MISRRSLLEIAGGACLPHLHTPSLAAPFLAFGCFHLGGRAPFTQHERHPRFRKASYHSHQLHPYQVVIERGGVCIPHLHTPWLLPARRPRETQKIGTHRQLMLFAAMKRGVPLKQPQRRMVRAVIIQSTEGANRGRSGLRPAASPALLRANPSGRSTGPVPAPVAGGESRAIKGSDPTVAAFVTRVKGSGPPREASIGIAIEPQCQFPKSN